MNDAIPVKIIICIENHDFDQYLRASAPQYTEEILFVQIENVPRAVADNPEAVLVLQSDNHENIFFEIGKKLKGVFFKNLKVIFTSFDYQIKSDALKSFSSFLQAPCTLTSIIDEAKRLIDLRRKILLIDDSKLVHKNLVGPLKDKGFIVHQAFNGKEGLDKASETKPDLIICDIEMPVMNGFEACAAIRANRETQDCYIIMSSTLKSAEDQKKGFAAGVDEYMPKPVIFKDLLERINRSFELQSVLREKILIIDGDAAQAENISNFLDKQGFSVKICSGLVEAEKLLRKFKCDLILASNNMIDGSLIELSQFCEKHRSQSDFVFIGIVAQENEAERRMALNSGARDTISSPLTSEAVAAVVERTVADLRSKSEMRQFQKYVSKASFQSALEKSVLADLDLPSRAEKRQAVIFFMDIARFTSRCERYPPEEIVRQINNMFEKITEIITDHDGDIDKFIGDACMAFWFDDKAEGNSKKALAAILTIKRAILELNANDPILKSDPIRVRIGLNVGDVILCDIGASKARVDLTMIGDAVNIAARLESACATYFIDNLVSENVVASYCEEFVVRKIDKVLLHGKDQALNIYEVMSHATMISEDEKQLIDLFSKGFDAYELGDFPRALEHFSRSKILEQSFYFEQNPSDVYIDRCQKLISDPPTDWSGVWKMKSK